MTLYKTLLGDAFSDLPPQVQAFHGTPGKTVWAGTANVQNGNILARIVARLVGFPKPGNNMPLTVTRHAGDTTDHWTRDFNGHALKSQLTAEANGITETFGPFKVTLALSVENNRLAYTPIAWKLFGIPMPKALLPTGESFETEEKGAFIFDITVTAPIIGLIAAYKGTLKQVH